MRISRKFLSLLLIGCVLCFSCHFAGVPSKAATVQTGYVNDYDVNVRADASTTSKSLGKLSYKTVTVNGSKKGIVSGDTHTWYNITYENLTGYIRDDFLTLNTVTVTADPNFENQIKGFPDSYKTALRNLHATYPNWNFVADGIGLTLDEAVNLEITRKLVSNTSAVSWLSMGSGAYDWNKNTYVAHDTNWRVASREVIRYYMDPRNFLTASDIFMYASLKYDASIQTKAGVEAIIKGTFMEKGNKNNKYGDYAELLMAAAKDANVNAYALAAKIIQEQGTAGTSDLISGTYTGYPGYYNFFNVQTYGDTHAAKVAKGLSYAKEHGWNSIEASIKGGAVFWAGTYIYYAPAGQENTYVKQDTYFKMDFNVQNPARIWHEYAGAVHDALGCGQKLAKGYAGNTSTDITFYIPVYKNMPSAVSALPAKNGNCNNYYFNSIATSGLSPSFSRFTYSYTLVMDGNQTVTVTVPSGASYASNASYALNTGKNTVVLKVKSQSGYTNDYTLNITATKACTLYVDYGQGGSTPTVTKPPLMHGDTNGNTVVDGRDLANVQMHILKVKLLTGDAYTAADTNSDGAINGRDLANIQMHILGVKLLK